MASTTFELSVDKVLSVEDRAHIASVLELIASAHGLQLDTNIVEPKLTYKIEQERHPDNPRKEWDNAGVMFCRHRRYTLGDEGADDPFDEIECGELDGKWYPVKQLEYALDMLYEIGADADVARAVDGACQASEPRMFLRDDIAICLPLYLYDHSGVTISHGAFSCKWDSGQVGWHYITKSSALANFNACGDFADIDEAKLHERLKAELKTYDDYLQGNVWGYVIEDEEGDDVDSCWGFYGDELEETGMLGHVEDQHVEGIKEAWERRFG